MFESGLVDEVVVYLAPKVCGGASAPTPVGGAGAALMADALQLGKPQVDIVGDDVRLTYRLNRGI
jgi:diaminohydroxyphosphoribosylaminopyrimidine deaminase/5-amino-6-(5-phosphoribosylamino)uracil reductase